MIQKKFFILIERYKPFQYFGKKDFFLFLTPTGRPLCIGTANQGYLEAKMQSDKKIIFFQNIEKVYISQ